MQHDCEDKRQLKTEMLIHKAKRAQKIILNDVEVEDSKEDQNENEANLNKSQRILYSNL